MNKLIYLLVLVLLLFACREEDFGAISIDPETGWFPETPVNLAELNSAFDEHNSSLRILGNRISLYYSTNANKKGKDFDISSATIDIQLNADESQLNLEISGSTSSTSSQIATLANTSANEVGTYSFNSNFGSKWYFFYANENKGQYDIKYLYKPTSSSSVKGPFDANILNSNVCDFYPSINQEQNKMIFSSYRSKKYDLYEIELNGNDLKEWLDTGENKAIMNTTISSSEDDKCPYWNGKLLVFASDRPGGYGAYDLWYSVLQDDGAWSAPINFGPEINTEHDEFGPATAYFQNSNNDFMLFSSNRPGGKGGYDLYFVGIPKMIK